MTGYRAFSYDFVKGFPILSKGFEIETEMTIHAIDKNFKILEIPINYKDRIKGSFSKLNTYKDGFKVLKTIYILFKEYKPAYCFNLLSIILIITSLLFNGYLRYLLIIMALLLWISGKMLNVIVKKEKQRYELLLNIICRNK